MRLVALDQLARACRAVDRVIAWKLAQELQCEARARQRDRQRRRRGRRSLVLR